MCNCAKLHLCLELGRQCVRKVEVKGRGPEEVAVRWKVVRLLWKQVAAGDASCRPVDFGKHDTGLFSQEECQTTGFLPLPLLSRLYLRPLFSSDENVG